MVLIISVVTKPKTLSIVIPQALIFNVLIPSTILSSSNLFFRFTKDLSRYNFCPQNPLICHPDDQNKGPITLKRSLVPLFSETST